MTKQEETRKKDRRDLLLVLLILPLGILCMFFVGGAAIKLAPGWVLPADMGSNLDPNVDFAARSNPQLIQPINPGILTQPVWGPLFLTPNALIPTRVIPTAISTQQPQPTSRPTTIPVPTNNPTITPLPTGIILPPPTRPPPGPRPTSTPLPTSTPTFTSTPIPSADLGISKDDGSGTYTPGAGISYTIVVTNAGPDNASVLDIIDNVPTAITGLTITCVPVGVASCGTDGTVGNSMSYTNASLDAGAGNQITITISGTVDSGTTGDLTNTVNIVIPGGAGFLDPDLSNNSATDTNTATLVADLSITKTDFVTVYLAGSITKYVVAVTNAGPSAVTGATVTDNIPTQISSWDWTCFEFGGASGCTPVAGSAASFTDDAINLPVGGSIVYFVDANIDPAAVGDLVNTASIAVPVGVTDPNLGNNTATDTDNLITGIDIGPPNGVWEEAPVTVIINPPIDPDGTGTPDMVFYERYTNPATQLVEMDNVLIEISPDGQAWYPVFYWGDGVPDTNTNLDINVIGGAEDDNRQFIFPSDGILYNGRGVTIDIDAIPGIVGGTEYFWVRLTDPAGTGDPPEIDAIQPYYP